MFEERDARETFGRMETDILFVGHSHVPGIFSSSEERGIKSFSSREAVLSPGEKMIVNAGSVGQPRDGDPRASYCIYDSDRGVVRTKRVSYDVKKAKEKILAEGLPPSLAYRLSEGR
jgi:diadenosine tetraphosphatase ApaH/serine/threonine PP2A family protein phosphatase